jgi:hypothetical protein
MQEALVWVYLLNSVLLINHEIDSAYWKEWDLFKLPGGITGFLLLHFPMLFVLLLGLLLVVKGAYAGLVISLLASGGGVFAFFIHSYFLKKGRHEFNAPMSLFILWALLLVSLAQMVITICLVWEKV